MPDRVGDLGLHRQDFRQQNLRLRLVEVLSHRRDQLWLKAADRVAQLGQRLAAFGEAEFAAAPQRVGLLRVESALDVGRGHGGYLGIPVEKGKPAVPW